VTNVADATRGKIEIFGRAFLSTKYQLIFWQNIEGFAKEMLAKNPNFGGTFKFWLTI